MKKFMIVTGCIIIAGVLAAVGSVGSSSEQVICRVELDRAILPAEAPQTAVVKVTLDAAPAPRETERPPVNLAIVLDRSGSMSGQKIAKARQAAITALRQLTPRDRFSLIIYDNEVETLIPSTPAANTEWIEGRIRGIRSRGNTALYGGVSQGAAEIRKHLDGNYVHRLILLSDGLANVGPSSPDDLGRLGASLRKEGISVTTVGVGTDYNEDLMTQLAQRSDGNTYFVEDSGDLPRIFAAELGDVLSVVARKVRLEIECPAGIRPVRIIGRDGRIRDNTVEITMNQLYGGQAKYALVEVEVPAGHEDDVRKIAAARCSYENALNQRQETSRGEVTAKFSRRREEVARSANKKVQQDIVLNVVAETKDKVVTYWDKGDHAAAERELEKQKEKLSEVVDQYDLDNDTRRQVEQLEEERDNLRQEGMTRSRRKSYRASSYQTKNQQLAQ